MNAKKAIRNAYLEKRAVLTLAQKHALLAAMIDTMQQIPATDAKMLMGYKAINRKNEVPTELFEQILFDQDNDLQVCYPSVDFETRQMVAYLDDESIEWEHARFGLLQPCAGHMVPPEKIDIIFVPLLAFDLNGYRLGYGMGFYDRFLCLCRKDVLKIGLCWFEAETRLPEIQPYDVPLNYCITPNRLYVF